MYSGIIKVDDKPLAGESVASISQCVG